MTGAFEPDTAILAEQLIAGPLVVKQVDPLIVPYVPDSVYVLDTAGFRENEPLYAPKTPPPSTGTALKSAAYPLICPAKHE